MPNMRLYLQLIKPMNFKISNESKVGVLAAIAITFLILGYNFMSGRASFFSSKFKLNAILTDVTEINTSTPILYKGFKIGNVNTVEMTETLGKFNVLFVINEDISIPEDSKLKVIGTLLNGKSLNLMLGNSSIMVKNNGVLGSIADTSLMESVGDAVKPLSDKINSIVASLDSLLSHGELNQTIAHLNNSLKSFTKTSDNAAELIKNNLPKIDKILSNVESISSNLAKNNKAITLIINNLKATTDNLAAANLKEAVENANKSLVEFNEIVTKINDGKGTLGLLINDKELYQNLNKTAFDLDVLLKDFNKFPAKYIPIPFTKKQRKNAIEQSENSKN